MEENKNRTTSLKFTPDYIGGTLAGAGFGILITIFILFPHDTWKKKPDFLIIPS